MRPERAPAASLVPGTLDVLANTAATLRAILAAIPDEVTYAAGDGGWSPRDVAAHLALRAGGQNERVRLMLDADDPFIANVDEEATLDRSGFRNRPLGELLDIFATARADSLRLVGTLTTEQLARTARHEVAGQLRVDDMIHHIAWHDLLHVRQVCALLAAPLDAARVAMGASFPESQRGFG